ncbi:hypothetical protein PUN28_000564 [Cardiocondyla obscurior]|uniref:Secreted protein n=1 Tax=Cardiocondyla obscurior TaxID=286306 RepID=A0AAW2H0K3_9HYME
MVIRTPLPPLSLSLTLSALHRDADALRDAPRCRSQSCTPAGLYISGDAALARLYLYTITHCYPSDVTVSPVTVHRRQSCQATTTRRLDSSSSAPIRRCPPSTIFVLSFANRFSQCRGHFSTGRCKRDSLVFSKITPLS